MLFDSMHRLTLIYPTGPFGASGPALPPLLRTVPQESVGAHGSGRMAPITIVWDISTRIILHSVSELYYNNVSIV